MLFDLSFGLGGFIKKTFNIISNGNIIPIGCTVNGNTYTTTSSSNDRADLDIDNLLISDITTSTFEATVSIANGSADTRIRLASNGNGGFEVLEEVSASTGQITLSGKPSADATTIYFLVYPDVNLPYDGSVDILDYEVREYTV